MDGNAGKKGPTSVAQWEGWSEAEGLRRRASDARRHNDKKKRVTSKPSLTFWSPSLFIE